MSIDVDRLQEVNDDHGRMAGDELLQGVASTLQLLIRSSDVLARVGGDEFAAILPDIQASQAAGVADAFAPR